MSLGDYSSYGKGDLIFRKPALGEDSHNIEELPQSLLEFKRIYNENWSIQRHGYKTPVQARREQSQALPPAA